MPQVSVVIATRNRWSDLRVAIESCVAQENVDFEILVYDDASSDETRLLSCEILPDSKLRVFRNNLNEGYIANRNRGFSDARAPIVVSLDDDAYFAARNTLSRVLEVFDRDPDVSAVAMPYIEPLNRLSRSSQLAPFRSSPGDQLRSYVGTAHAIRREVALKLGGYRAFFVHQHEERDLCLRILEAGGRVIYANTPPIVHMVSPKGRSERIIRYGARNQILIEFLNTPLPDVILRLVRTPLGIILYRFNFADLPLKVAAIGSGFLECLQRWKERRPVRRGTYSLFRRLPGHGPENWEGQIPPPCHLERKEHR